ncbi:hypothetical protein DYH09_29110 [bacterium CPR1]|nr:hypothetical protein [bacterium CPR1]
MAPNQVQLDLEHSVDLDFELGVFASFSAWGLFSVGTEALWNVSDFLDLTIPATAQASHQLTNTIGSLSLTSANLGSFSG